MRFNSVALCLLAGALSNALPAPQEDPTPTSTALPTAASSDIVAAADQLEQLAAHAQEVVEEELEAAAKKRGTCNISNVAVRREWYVKRPRRLHISARS
jgi:tyrosinase